MKKPSKPYRLALACTCASFLFGVMLATDQSSGACARGVPTVEPSPSVSSEPGPTVAPTALPDKGSPNLPSDQRSSPVASPSPPPLPTAVPRGVRVSADFLALFANQGTSGPGIRPFEGPAYVSGGVLAPGTPFDLISTEVQTPGNGLQTQLHLRAQSEIGVFETGLDLGAGYVRGSANNLGYYGEPLLPTLNPHLGARAFTIPLALPTHAGQDDVTALRASVLAGYVGTNDGRIKLQAGFFDIGQSDIFVFNQPGDPNLIPSLAPAYVESLGKGAPSLLNWTQSDLFTPLHGIDFQVKPGALSIEFTDATLPSLPGTTSRATIGSIVFARSPTSRFSADIVHLVEAGAPIGTPALYGADATITPSSQGNVVSSTLRSQRQTLVGFRSAFRLPLNLDTVLEVGHSVYSADGVKHPGLTPGGFYHVAFSKTIGRVTPSLEYLRFDPTYATSILPYGVPENQFNLTYAWPGQWLKSTAQLVDNSIIGDNREGVRVRYSVEGGPLEVRAAYTDYHQVEPYTLETGSETGFVESIFLPQADAGTLARLHRYAFWAAWHPAVATFSLDLVEDTIHRTAPAGHPEDAASYDAPEATFSISRAVNASTLVSAGIARFAQRGSFGFGGATNVDYAQRTVFLGAQFAVTPNAGTLVEVRRSTYDGIPTTPNTHSPAYAGWQVILEQRLHF